MNSTLFADNIRVATFNVSMEGTNYGVEGAAGAHRLKQLLGNGEHPQIRNIAAIIQRVRPDVLLLNEFDYIADDNSGAQAFIRHYLNRAQPGSESIDYPYFYTAPVNTGEPSPFDLDQDGIASGTGNDAWGFGHYPCQYGMLLLSRFPIAQEQVRQFQHFRWADLPGARAPLKPDGSTFYPDTVWQALRLSSKSHWDVPVLIGKEVAHILVSHPTPPVFDGAEKRNALRNRDEIRFWQLYVDPLSSSGGNAHGGVAYAGRLRAALRCRLGGRGYRRVLAFRCRTGCCAGAGSQQQFRSSPGVGGPAPTVSALSLPRRKRTLLQ